MMLEKNLFDVQKLLKNENLDGWLLYDFQKRNHLAIDFLKIAKNSHLTRRMFYWIPLKGDPIKIVSSIEPYFLDHLPGIKKEYKTWQQLHSILSSILSSAKHIAMEYSLNCLIPYQSLVDAGTVDLIRSIGPCIHSSSAILQNYTCVLDDFQMRSHLEAANFLDATANSTFDYISSCLNQDVFIDEYKVQQFIKAQFSSNGFITDADPICAVNANSSNPHYCPSESLRCPIRKGDFVLIDLWCKKNHEQAIYADISRVAVADFKASQKQQEIFSIVRKAQKETTNFIINSFHQKIVVRGCDADQIARNIIEQNGYGSYFTHRTGHNIYINDHGPGTHLDSYETYDDRKIIPGTCFSVEPGIYLPDQFGVRLEYDILINKEGKIEVTGGIQEEIVSLL